MPELSAIQIIGARDLMQRICPNLALAMSEQLNHEVVVGLLDLEDVSLSDLLSRSESAVQTQFTLSQPEGSESVFAISEEAARVVINLMEGRPASDTADELTEAEIDTLSVGISGLIRGFTSAITQLTGDAYELESSSTQLGALTVPPVFALEGNAVEVRFSLSIPGILESEISALFTTTLMAELIQSFEEASQSANAIESEGTLDQDGVAAMLGKFGSGESAEIEDRVVMPISRGATSEMGASAPFSNLLHNGMDFAMPRGLDMILDIPLDVTVELGRVRMLIKDVLDLASGSIIELDRVAGEPVDLLVNGRLVAKGEVVVIEDNFGIRITEITSPAERVAGLGKGR